MGGGALVGFRSGTIESPLRETSLNRIIAEIFLAYQMPRCQEDVIFAISSHRLGLTILFLAYQMPYGRILRKPDARQGGCELAIQDDG
jgi:hypothetical protein